MWIEYKLNYSDDLDQEQALTRDQMIKSRMNELGEDALRMTEMTMDRTRISKGE